MTRSLLALVLVGACSSPAAVVPDAAAPPPEGDLPIDSRFQPLVDQIQMEQAQLGAPGVAVLVMENGTITFAHGFGLKNPDAADKVDAGTLFRIGSVTKMLTTTGLLELVASGQVGLDGSGDPRDPRVQARRARRSRSDDHGAAPAHPLERSVRLPRRSPDGRPDRRLAVVVHHRHVLLDRVPDGSCGADVELLEPELHPRRADARERRRRAVSHRDAGLACSSRSQ